MVGVIALSFVLLSLVSGPAAALFPINNFSNVDDTATVTPSGQNLGVSGWIKCTEGEIAEVRVTVTQGSTQATGRTHLRCEGESVAERWEVRLAARGPDAFDPDRTVRVDAWGVTRSRGKMTDGPRTWSNPNVT